MTACPNCKKTVEEGASACPHCRTPIAPAKRDPLQDKRTRLYYFALLGIWYLIVWPLLSFELVFSLALALTGCAPGRCELIRSPLDELSSAALVGIACVILLLFVLSWRAASAGRGPLRLLAETHRYACLLAPAAIGIGSHDWPAPFLLALPYAFAHPAELPLLLTLFAVTWLLVLVVALHDALSRRGKPDS